MNRKEKEEELKKAIGRYINPAHLREKAACFGGSAIGEYLHVLVTLVILVIHLSLSSKNQTKKNKTQKIIVDHKATKQPKMEEEKKNENSLRRLGRSS